MIQSTINSKLTKSQKRKAQAKRQLVRLGEQIMTEMLPQVAECFRQAGVKPRVSRSQRTRTVYFTVPCPLLVVRVSDHRPSEWYSINRPHDISFHPKSKATLGQLCELIQKTSNQPTLEAMGVR